ncbi:MAG TPA: ATP-binding protein [Myxococcota bacterium]
MLVQDAAFAHALLLSLRSGLVAVDAGGRVAAISAEAARLLGVSPRLGEPASAALATQPEVLAQLEAARVGRAAPRAELTLRGPGGEAHTIGFTALPVASGGAAILFRDLTPLERQTEQERLTARLAALGQMAAGLAHEIRNPLASIELLAGLVAREASALPAVKELAEEISREVHAVEATIEVCLAWVKPEPAQRSPLDLTALVDDALRRALGRAPFAGRVERELDARAAGSGDYTLLRSALENLLANAAQAMNAHARAGAHALTVRSAPLAGGGFALSVEDTGPGVSPELRERIFFPFFTTRASGSGIGLAWVQKAVAAHGGSVSVSDRPGGGARFTLHIPGPASA